MRRLRTVISTLTMGSLVVVAALAGAAPAIADPSVPTAGSPITVLELPSTSPDDSRWSTEKTDPSALRADGFHLSQDDVLFYVVSPMSRGPLSPANVLDFLSQSSIATSHENGLHVSVNMHIERSHGSMSPYVFTRMPSAAAPTGAINPLGSLWSPNETLRALNGEMLTAGRGYSMDTILAWTTAAPAHGIVYFSAILFTAVNGTEPVVISGASAGGATYRFSSSIPAKPNDHVVTAAANYDDLDCAAGTITHGTRSAVLAPYVWNTTTQTWDVDLVNTTGGIWSTTSVDIVTTECMSDPDWNPEPVIQPAGTPVRTVDCATNTATTTTTPAQLVSWTWSAAAGAWHLDLSRLTSTVHVEPATETDCPTLPPVVTPPVVVVPPATPTVPPTVPPAATPTAPPAATPTNTTPAATLSAGGQSAVEGAGFRPGERVEVWLHSTPVKLDTLTARSDGSVSGTVTIPADTPAGIHHLVLRGEDGAEVSSADMTISPASATASRPTGALPNTGPNAGTPLWWALSLLALGAAALVIRRRTRTN